MKWKLFKAVALVYGAYKILSNALLRKVLFILLKHESQKLLR